MFHTGQCERNITTWLPSLQTVHILIRKVIEKVQIKVVKEEKTFEIP